MISLKLLSKWVFILFWGIITFSVHSFATPTQGLCNSNQIFPETFMSAAVVTIEKDSISFNFDKSRWRNGYAQRNSSSAILEFVTGNETVENWSELVTIQYLKGIQEKISPEGFANMSKKHEESKMGQYVKFTILEISDNDALFEWQVEGYPGISDEHTITRVIKGKDHMILLHYAGRPHINEENRNIWIAQLKNATWFEQKTN